MKKNAVARLERTAGAVNLPSAQMELRNRGISGAASESVVYLGNGRVSTIRDRQNHDFDHSNLDFMRRSHDNGEGKEMVGPGKQ